VLVVNDGLFCWFDETLNEEGNLVMATVCVCVCAFLSSNISPARESKIAAET